MSVWRVKVPGGSFQVTPNGIQHASPGILGSYAAMVAQRLAGGLPKSAILDPEGALADALAERMGGTATLIARGKPLPKGTVI